MFVMFWGEGRWRGSMKHELVTFKLTPEIKADLDDYAAAHHPMTCPKCHGTKAIRTGPCPRCAAQGAVGNRSDAIRYLLHFSLGRQASPEARAMAAVYSNTAPRLISAFTVVSHETLKTLHQEIVTAIEASGFRTQESAPPSGRRRR